MSAPAAAPTMAQNGIVAHGVNTLRSEKHSVLVITHYQRLLKYLIPDHVHVLAEGRIVISAE